MASYALNAPPSVPLTYITLFGIGAVVKRGAGCTINDMWDYKLDRAVGAFYTSFRAFLTRTDHPRAAERTKSRPIAAGDITPRQAFISLVPQLSAGLAVLTQLNWQRCASSPSHAHSRRTYPLR